MSTNLYPVLSLFITAVFFPTLAMAQPAYAGPDVMVCGDEYDMQANTPAPPGSGVWTLISGCGFLMDDTDPNTHLYGLCPGSSVWRWSTVDAGGVQTSSVVEVISFDPNVPPANAGPDVTITLPNNYVQLQGSPEPNPPMLCSWSIVSGTGTIANPSDPNTMVHDLGVGFNVFRWSCENGPCGTTLDEVNVQLMLVSGIGSTGAEISKLFHYEPSTQQLVITKGAPITDMMIVDALGRSMTQLPSSAGAGTWDLSAWPTGMYLLRATVGGSSQVYRFVVER
ncbi:MAG: T9SS type A sorting domain-containing protein [Flavobacteriales bacterium]